MDLLSIIVPVYNVEEYLKRCLDSVINQSYKNLEIILVDDGSTDSSGSICDEYAARDNRIRVIHKSNGGLSDARNAGLEICRGEYIGFVDSDDYIELDMYEVLYKFAIVHRLDVCMCSSADVIDGKVINSSLFDAYVCDSKERIINDLFINNRGGTSITVWSKLFKKYIFENIRFDYGKTYEDCFFILKWIEKTDRFGRISDNKYYYVKRQGSITNQKLFKESMLDVVEAFENNFNTISDKFPQSLASAEYRLLWAYRTAIISIINCADYENHRAVIQCLQDKMKKIVWKFMFANYITCKNKLIYLFLTYNVSLYLNIKRIKLFLKK